MDLGTLLGLIVGLGVPLVGAILAVGKAFQKLKDHDEELADMKETQDQHAARIAEAEKVRSDVNGVAAAVKSLGDLFGEKLGNLADKLNGHNDNTSRRFDEMKRDTERRFDELNERLSERRSFRQSDK